MTETRDLDNRGDIEAMVHAFYGKVQVDPLLGPLFNDVAAVDWPTHLDKLTAFWSRVLLNEPGYAGNPFRAHVNIHEQQCFTRNHFERWLRLFHETIDSTWSGPYSEAAKEMGRRVAAVHSNQLIGERFVFDPNRRMIPLGVSMEPAS
ncbi:MAG: group III truncated hemoglobin [Actinobacteria bacterium]|nr:group III truncated hemoglobin [Actinomycetota bacterium]